MVVLCFLARFASHLASGRKLTRVRLRGRGAATVSLPPSPAATAAAPAAPPVAAAHRAEAPAIPLDGPLGRFVSATPTRALPVLIVAHRRPKTFDLTLRSLLRVAGVSPANVYVVQDGALAAVKTSATTHGIAERNFHQRAGPRGAVAKEKRIATHYKYALEWIFARVGADVPGVIVVEDDLLFAPDWMRYFRAVAPLLESDETLISASAWNDNAFVHNVDRVAGAGELRRTTNFPGLSWLLPRALWKTQLSASWPAEHWDHWMRDATTHRGRETLCPAISRVWHHGARGANVSPQLQAAYFDPVALALDAAPWSAADVAGAARAPYEKRLEALLSGAKHSGAGFAATLAALLDDARIDGTAVALWYSLPDGSQAATDSARLAAFKPLAAYLRLWHEPRRTAHFGLHEVWGPAPASVASGGDLGRGRLLLVDARSPRYGRFIPSGTAPIALGGGGAWPSPPPPPLYAAAPSASMPRLATLSAALGLDGSAAPAKRAAALPIASATVADDGAWSAYDGADGDWAPPANAPASPAAAPKKAKKRKRKANKHKDWARSGRRKHRRRHQHDDP